MAKAKICLAACLMTAALPIQAKEYHVSKQGCNTTDGSAAHPLLTILFNGKKIDGKSIMQVMTACIKCGAEIEIQCSGPDEQEMLLAAADLINAGIGDEI